MTSGFPKITVGMPAYNSEANIRLAIEGLLAQTLGDLELIISDNASTDGTRDIVEEYCKLDSRVRYVRHAKNIGANPNYSCLVGLARGRFFKWSSSSDWCAPSFLARCKEVLEAHADTVLVVPRTQLFCDEPSVSECYPGDLEVLDESPVARLVRLNSELALNNAMNGLIRTSALRSTRAIEPYLLADVVLMGHLALLGKFRLLPEYLYYRRMDVRTATALQNKSAVWRHHYPQWNARVLFQSSKRHLGLLRAVLTVPLPAEERRRALMYIAKRCYWERDSLLEDLRGVWSYCIRKTSPE